MTNVSILVFLDSLLRRQLGYRFLLLAGGFNPCFSGFTSTTLGVIDRHLTGAVVSILVFLDSLLRPDRR